MRFIRFGLVVAVLLAGCARVHLTTWRGPVLASQPYKKILVCVSPRGLPNGLDLERAVVKAFASHPVAAAAGLDVFPVAKTPPADQLEILIPRQGFDAVLVLERHSIIRWGEASQGSPPDRLPDFLAKYVAGAKPDKNPVKMDVAVSHELGGPLRHVQGVFALYDMATGQMVWKADQAAKAPTFMSSERFVGDVAGHNVEELAKEDLIPPAPQSK